MYEENSLMKEEGHSFIRFGHIFFSLVWQPYPSSQPYPSLTHVLTQNLVRECMAEQGTSYSKHRLMCPQGALQHPHMWSLFSLNRSKTKASTCTKLGKWVYGGTRNARFRTQTKCLHRGPYSSQFMAPQVLLIDQKRKHPLAPNSVDGCTVGQQMLDSEHRPNASTGGTTAPNLWPHFVLKKKKAPSSTKLGTPVDVVLCRLLSAVILGLLTQYNMRPIHRKRSSTLGKAESLHIRERGLRRKPPRGSHSHPCQRSKSQTAQDHGKDNASPGTTMLHARSTHDRHWQKRKSVWAYPMTTHRHMSNWTLMHHNVLGHTA